MRSICPVRVLLAEFLHWMRKFINVSSAVTSTKGWKYTVFFVCFFLKFVFLYCDLVERTQATEQSTDMALFGIWPAHFPVLSLRFYTYITRKYYSTVDSPSARTDLSVAWEWVLVNWVSIYIHPISTNPHGCLWTESQL